MTSGEVFTVIDGDTADPYRDRVEHVYADDPQLWRAAIGDDLWFEFGVYDKPDRSLDDAGHRYFELQLELAGLPDRAVGRVLDVGFGWGTTLLHLARCFPDARIDGVNISVPQIRCAAQRLAAEGLADRVRLYQCNARDVGRLPNREQSYELAIMRGCIAHFTMETLNSAIAGIADRTADGASLVISDPLYNVPVGDYQSPIDDRTDRLACGNRKTLSMLLEVLERNSFTVRDVREIPSSDEAVRWLGQVKENIEKNLPDHGIRAFQEMVDVADNLSLALTSGVASVYSVVARRRARPASG